MSYTDYAGPPPAGQPDGPSPIGVPPGYTATVTGAPPYRPGVQVERPPLYFDGDDWAPGSLSPAEIARLQTRLVEARLLDPDGFQLGAWDVHSRSAYRALLAEANGAGRSWQMTLNRRRDLARMFPEAKPQRERAPLVTRVTNPADIKRLLKETFREKLGSGDAVDPATLDRMVAAYQGKEAAAQTAAYNAAETGGQVVDAPSFDTFADQQAQQTDPTAFDAYKMLDKFSVLLDTFGGP